MGPHWERQSDPPAVETPLLLDAVLKPHRSLSPKAFRWMLIAVIAINLAISLYFIAHRAAPIAGFMGLDALALWWAFRVNYRAARIEERVQVDREHIHVARRNQTGEVAHWVVSPLWARVASDRAGVTIRSAGGALRIASFLAPEQRDHFVRDLDNALWRAKRGG